MVFMMATAQSFPNVSTTFISPFSYFENNGRFHDVHIILFRREDTYLMDNFQYLPDILNILL